MFERKKEREFKKRMAYAKDLAERQLRWLEAKKLAMRKVESYIEYAHRNSHGDEKKGNQD